MRPQKLSIPYNFTPRSYQTPILEAFDAGANRLVACWHRRAGKEKTFINLCAREAFQRVGLYLYCFPTYAQGKKVIWTGRDRDGFPFLGHFPSQLVTGRHETEMKLTLRGGSIFQVVGTENIDSLMGTNPVGVVFSEYALQNPAAWEYLRPILTENGGWVVFDSTPRGKNHFYTLFDMARERQAAGDRRWFCERLTYEDTGVFTEEQIEQERREGMSEEMISQEYRCSFEGVREGAYFGREMATADREGRIGREVRYQPELPVHTWWDLGMDDATAIIFTQDVGREVHVIDYYENSGEGLPHYARELQKRGYVYGSHHAPHDIAVREMGSGKSRWETAAGLGVRFQKVPDVGFADGVDAARAFLTRCWFHTGHDDRGKAVERLRLALVSYHKHWDEKRKVFSSHPHRDWTTHPADAFRYLAVGHKVAVIRPRQSRDVYSPMTSSETSWMAA
jgi:hypothetical protein